jgi:hypothetical protein
VRNTFVVMLQQNRSYSMADFTIAVEQPGDQSEGETPSGQPARRRRYNRGMRGEGNLLSTPNWETALDIFRIALLRAAYGSRRESNPAGFR